MGIDLTKGTVIPVTKVPLLLGRTDRNGSFVSAQQVMRGVLKGLNGCKLDAVKCGSRWLTTVEAVQEWVERQAERAGRDCAPASDPPRTTRRAADENPDRELKRRGL